MTGYWHALAAKVECCFNFPFVDVLANTIHKVGIVLARFSYGHIALYKDVNS